MRDGSHLGHVNGTFTFIAPAGFCHPKTRACVRLLGPCFKTGRMKPYDRQRPWRAGAQTRRGRDTVQLHCAQSSMLAPPTRREGPPEGARRDSSVRPDAVTRGYNTLRRVLPSPKTYPPVRTVVDADDGKVRRRARGNSAKTVLRICTPRHPHARHLNFRRPLLIPCASLLTVSRTLNFLFKVLFIFPSRYLFAIGLVPVFSFRRSLPPVLGCIPKQPDSEKAPRRRESAAHTGFSPSTTRRSKRLYRRPFAVTVLLETTIRRPERSEISSLSSSRFTRRY